MKEIERHLLQYEQQGKTNELVGSQYAHDICENKWLQAYCVTSYTDYHYSRLADLYMRDLTYDCGFYCERAVKLLEEHYFTLV